MKSLYLIQNVLGNPCGVFEQNHDLKRVFKEDWSDSDVVKKRGQLGSY